MKSDITWGGCDISFDITWAIYKDVFSCLQYINYIDSVSI